MKKISTIISASAIAIATVLPLGASAVSYLTDGAEITYEESGSNAIVTAVEVTDNTVVLPDSINAEDGTELQITALDSKAFSLQTELVSVTLPSSLAEIGANAFQGCFNLSTIAFPDKLEKLGEGAFMSCTSLVDIDLTDTTLSEIPDYCFYACTGLENVTIGENISSIGAESFFGCPDLTITIPETVTSIGENAIGVHLNPHTNEIIPYDNVLIIGTSGSVAEEYAETTGIDFIDTENFLSGDVDFNGSVDAADASYVLKEYANISTNGERFLSKKQYFPADFNNDGSIDASDASAILKEYVRLSTK